MTNNIDELIAGMPPFLSSRLRSPGEEAGKQDINPLSNSGALSGTVRIDQPEEAPAEDAPLDDGPIPHVLGLVHSEIQVFRTTFQVTASIAVPQLTTYYMKFQNVLVAEDKLVVAREDDTDARFGRWVYSDFLVPMRPINVMGPQHTNAYRFAASPLYRDTDFERACSGRVFAIPIWDNSVMTNLWLLDGGKFHDVRLVENEGALKNPRSPLWEGKVKLPISVR